MTDVKQELPVVNDTPLCIPRLDVLWNEDSIFRRAELSDILALLPLLEPEQKEAALQALNPWIRVILDAKRDERDAAIKRAEEEKGLAHDEALRRSEAEQNAARLATEKLGLLEELKRARLGWPSAIENIRQANEVIRELRERALLGEQKGNLTQFTDSTGLVHAVDPPKGEKP